MSLIDTIESKISEIANQIKTHSGYVTDIENAISKLATDKTTSTNNVNILNGAHQAYTDILNIVKAGETVVPAVEEAVKDVEDVKTVVGELV